VFPSWLLSLFDPGRDDPVDGTFDFCFRKKDLQPPELRSADSSSDSATALRLQHPRVERDEKARFASSPGEPQALRFAMSSS
jgi:hypothetical protein